MSRTRDHLEPLRDRGKRPKRTRFGLMRDPRTRKPIIKRSTDGVVYEQQPCRRCGVSIVRGHCACQSRRKPSPPSPGPIFAAFVAKARG